MDQVWIKDPQPAFEFLDLYLEFALYIRRLA
jgi:hypothetical protein